MENLCIQISKLDFEKLDQKVILACTNKDLPLGVKSGKMGVCVYFYLSSTINKNPYYKQIANKLLDEIIDGIAKGKSLNLLNGLTGIGICIDFLINKKIAFGDTNDILQEVDDLVFKHLSYEKYYEAMNLSTIIDLIIYLENRIKKQHNGTEAFFILNELIIRAINIFAEKINSDFFSEPFIYNIDYTLPKSMFALSKVYSLGICNERIERLLIELSPKILSFFPFLNSNRLLLLWGINAINSKMKLDGWDRYSKQLFGSLKIDYMINNEFRNKNVFLNNGLASIYLILDDLNYYFAKEDITLFKNTILKRIALSDIWKLMENTSYLTSKIGLLDGYCGISLLLKYINNKNHEDRP